MKVGSLFSGIGGIDLAFERAGFDVAWQVEWNRDAQSVLRRRWPEVPLYGDITEVATDCLSAVDIICGGSPCQSFSVAGSRQGLDGASGLFWHFIRVADSQPDAMVLWENVPVCCPPNTGATLRSSSGPSRDTTLQSLREAGVIPAFVSAPNDGSRGACLTLNTLEFRNGAAVSFLSEILWDGPLPSKYYLSPRACAGILRRATKRGKSLPPSLQAALEQTAQRG